MMKLSEKREVEVNFVVRMTTLRYLYPENVSLHRSQLILRLDDIIYVRSYFVVLLMRNIVKDSTA